MLYWPLCLFVRWVYLYVLLYYSTTSGTYSVTPDSRDAVHILLLLLLLRSRILRCVH